MGGLYWDKRTGLGTDDELDNVTMVHRHFWVYTKNRMSSINPCFF